VNARNARDPRTLVTRSGAALAVVASVSLTACSPTSDTTPASSSSAPSTEAPAPSPAPSTIDTPTPPVDGGDTATVVRFTSPNTSVDVTVDQDTPAARDFLSMLPTTVEVEEFNGREKIADLPRDLEYADTPGSDPENGDLVYFTPWGNLGFYYDASGIAYSDQTLHLGTYDASIDQLNALEGDAVTIERLP
jgi:hypothetical protein